MPLFCKYVDHLLLSVYTDGNKNQIIVWCRFYYLL